MARRRMLDPKIWESEEFGKMPLLARMIFIGLFSLADDDGRGLVSPAIVKRNILGFDDTVRVVDIEKALSVIGNKMSIQFYVVGDKKCYQLTNWKKWQKIDRPTESILPPPPPSEALGEGGELRKYETFDEHSTSTRRVVGEQSPLKIKEEEVKDKYKDDDIPPCETTPSASSSFSPNRAKELCQLYAPTYFKPDHNYSRNDFQAFYDAIDDPQYPLTEENLIKLLKESELSEVIKNKWEIVTLKGLINNRQQISNGQWRKLFGNKEVNYGIGNKRAEPYIPEHLKKRI